MSGDYSRWSFDPLRHFAGVLMQQGRVHTDADWNEWIASVLRRIRAGTLDTHGPAIVSTETPDAFRIAAAAGALTIAPGRMYVDGLLAENHGEAPSGWDPRLEQLTGTGAVDYAAQPYYPDAPALPPGGPHTVYLKVWQREVTSVEDPRLIEKALGVDTSTRLQTVWQVKVLPGDGTTTVECDTPLEDVPEFTDAEPAAAGRLTTATADVAGDPDPCLVPVGGGYKGLENQLYRVEIHDGGDLAGGDRATFKWSRDNATVASRVTEIRSLDSIVVESVGRDPVLRFSDGDWVEVTDDWRELNGLPGELRRISTPNGVDDVTRTILLDDPLPAGTFPVDAQERTDPTRNTRVRRWDQKRKVLASDGSVHVDLDLAGSGGVIPVATGANSILLESGVTVTFDLDPAGGLFRTGDHWVFAARTADASVEILDAAPPLGIHAHYALLGTVTLPDGETDLRSCPPPPPPEPDEGGCECSACVSVEDHASGALTIQDAIDAVVAGGGGTVCLDVGTYELPDTIRIHGARSVRLRGKGWSTVLIPARGGQAIDVQGSAGVTIEDLAVVTSSPEGNADAIVLGRSIAVSLEDLAVLHIGTTDSRSAAVALDGLLFGATIARCALIAGVGISGGARDDRYLATASLKLLDNWLLCRLRGIELERFSVHLADSRLAGNVIYGCREGGVTVLGGNALDGALEIDGNLCQTAGSGIVVATDTTRISQNDVRGLEGEKPADGIVLAEGLGPVGIDQLLVLGNRIRAVAGHGIAIRTRVESGLIKDNVIAETGGGGIVMDEGGEAGTLAVENNQLLGITGTMLGGAAHVAMLLGRVDRLDVATNTVDGLARDVPESQLRAGIAAVAMRTARIDSNRISGIAPPDESAGLNVGIFVVPPFQELDVLDNRVRRPSSSDEKVGPAAWIGLLVGAPDEEFDGGRFYSLGGLAVAVGDERTYLVSATRATSIVGARPGDVAVRGNTIESEATDRSPVFVSLARGLRLSDNRIQRLGEEGGRPSEVRCARAVVSSNELRDRIEQEVLDVRIIADGNAAILGNVHSGRILLNGNDLQQPWFDLNPFSFD